MRVPQTLTPMVQLKEQGVPHVLWQGAAFTHLCVQVPLQIYGTRSEKERDCP